MPSDKVTIGIPEEDDYEDLGPQQYDHPAYDSGENLEENLMSFISRAVS